jgi:hypothetical protein
VSDATEGARARHAARAPTRGALTRSRTSSVAPACASKERARLRTSGARLDASDAGMVDQVGGPLSSACALAAPPFSSLGLPMTGCALLVRARGRLPSRRVVRAVSPSCTQAPARKGTEAPSRVRFKGPGPFQRYREPGPL